MDAATIDERAPVPGFSKRLREATLVEHRATEQAPFIRRLLSGRAPLAAYSAMTAQWFFLYDALERAVTAAGADPRLGPFASDDLVRGPALADDLTTLIGPGWRSTIEITPATTVYTDRLAALASDWPTGLLAHHYLRYLGDLSGGQIIARVVRRTYRLENDAGTAFYRFDRIADIDAYKTAYRRRLDDLDVDEAERCRLIDEVDGGYLMTARIFDDLEQLVPTA